MPRNGSGTFSLVSGNPVVTGTSISSTTTNNTLSDIATALTGSLAADGQTPMTGNLNAGNNKLTAVAAAVALTDATTANDVQSGRLLYLTGTAGTNTVTASLSAFTTYAAGNLFSFIPANANTGATTLNLNSLGAKSIFRNGTALVGGELLASVPALVHYDGTQFNLVSANRVTSGTAVTASGTTVDFTAIPSWARRITVEFADLSTNGTSLPLLQLGDSGGIENASYAGTLIALANAVAVSASNMSTGFLLATSWGAASTVSGTVTLTLLNPAANTWVAQIIVGFTDTVFLMTGTGRKSTSAVLDRVRLTATNGTDTFDGGTVNVLYE